MMQTDELRTHLLALGDKKKQLEEEQVELMAVLESHSVGLRSPALVDDEGFPRADLDIVTIRTTRHKLHCLHTDIDLLQREIEEGLQKVFTEDNRALKPNGNKETKINGVDKASHGATPPSSSFCIVNSVSPGSPAELAGLKTKDEIVEFGSVNATNHNELAALGALVLASEDKTIKVKVSRRGEILELSLVPQKWAGRGLLGCHILPC